ncbi:MAG: vanadium-dependent haloperoxidase [Ferruginibacter sp.]
MKRKISQCILFQPISCFALIVVLFISSCKQNSKTPSLNAEEISNVLATMTGIMVHDITNPPLAARFFAYTCLAGYEVIVENNKDIKSMKGVLNEYPEIEKPVVTGSISYQLAALLAMMETAKKMQPSGPLMDKYEANFLDSCRTLGFDEGIIERSRNYGQAISKQILAYAKKDHYNQISNLTRYTPVKGEGYWYPTPPGFMAAVEPNFGTVRSFTLDSSACFKPSPPVVFSTEKNSPFYKLLDAVYKERKNHTPEHIAIASFWDCNPFAIQDEGHLMYAFKKISPGAHWLGITGIACLKANKSFDETLLIHTAVSVGLMDAFICCWDEKYRSNRIRPETAIRKLIDPTWQPLLQTPPFPEYLSGHSVASAASSVILTHYFGDHFSYRDSVEVSYGIPARSFNSFKEASDQAAISRFYGGIHFMDANINGLEQGTKVGENVVKKLKG